ncbi:hypothetical protein [Nocardia sp. NPDC020380]|uniref:hypothetical protein n=1 Tax=Nocardia sp. NPDC020380 TaxID=3364309 RepID=UPI0037BA48FA
MRMNWRFVVRGSAFRRSTNLIQYRAIDVEIVLPVQRHVVDRIADFITLTGLDPRATV